MGVGSAGNQTPEKLSKSAQKNKRKKENRQKTKEEVCWVVGEEGDGWKERGGRRERKEGGK